MIIGPKYRLARRLGPIFEKTQTQKFALRAGRRGKKEGGGRGMGGKTDFGIQMLEKQKARFTYRLTEKQFSRYVKQAVAKKGVNSAQRLVEILESRLDNVVLRGGIAQARGLAKQLVSHGHITVNGKRVTVPSIQLVPGDRVGIREGSKKRTVFNEVGKRLMEASRPSWLEYDAPKQELIMKSIPVTDPSLTGFNPQAVIEFYSR